MKKLIPSAALIILSSSSAALASSGVEGDGVGIMAYLFLGFFTLIIANQLVPGAILFVSLLRGLFSRVNKKPELAPEGSK